MHYPKKKKTFLAIHTKLKHVQSVSTPYVLSGDKMGALEEGEDQEDRIKQRFYTMQRINPLVSTVSISSMLYCIYRMILLLWV
ncbi:unnamed protein product [Staurois parvus]|uniref:Uncharacterized protein n=1 Tax=Staurois parvus TaxID=386267 RepID=A0ABN9HLM9_9NEOB|nr:unnamed protein product [Staurois parvus]